MTLIANKYQFSVADLGIFEFSRKFSDGQLVWSEMEVTHDCNSSDFFLSGLCRQPRNFFIVPVENRNEEALLLLIQEYIDCWRNAILTLTEKPSGVGKLIIKCKFWMSR